MICPRRCLFQVPSNSICAFLTRHSFFWAFWGQTSIIVENTISAPKLMYRIIMTLFLKKETYVYVTLDSLSTLHVTLCGSQGQGGKRLKLSPASLQMLGWKKSAHEKTNSVHALKSWTTRCELMSDVWFEGMIGCELEPVRFFNNLI